MTIRICAALAVALSTLPGLALDDPLALFPQDTGLVVRTSSPSELADAASSFLQNAAPQFVALTNQISAGMGSVVDNPTLQGIDPQRDWYLAVQFKADQRPQLIFAIPAKDAEAMKSALGEMIHARTYEGWVLYSRDQAAIEGLSAEPLPEGKSIQAAMDETVTKLFPEGNLSLFVNLPVLRETYQKQLDEFKKEIRDNLKEATIRGNPSLKSSLAGSQALMDMALSALESTTGVATSITIRKDAILADTVLVVNPDSETGQFLAKQDSSDFSLLKQLPAGWMGYYAAGGGLDKLVELALELSKASLADHKEKQASVTRLLKHGFQAAAGAFNVGDAGEGAYQLIALIRLESPDGFMADYRDLVKQMTHVEQNGVQQDTRLEVEAETIAGVPVDVSRTVMTFDPKSDPSGVTSRMMKLMFGEQGIVQRLALVEDLVLQSTGGGKDQMKVLIEAAKKAGETTSAAAALTKVQDEIGDSGQLFVAYDLPRVAKGFLSAMAGSGLVPFPPAMGGAVEDVELETSYAGVLVEIEDNHLWFREVFPASQAAGLVKLGMAIQRASRQGN